MAETSDAVREKYGAIARSVGAGSGCGPTACGCGDPISADLSERERRAFRGGTGGLARVRELTALIALEPAERSSISGGASTFCSAKRVGPAGKVYGLDMTDEMLALARENQRKAGTTNVEFLKGAIEAIPLPDNSVDVIISNCVINLSADKDAVLREAFRVLKPGGRFAVSDVVVRGDMPPEVRRSMELWVGCIAGALEETEYVSKLRGAGFGDVELEPWRTYRVEDARTFLSDAGLDVDRLAPEVDGRLASAFIRARKPAAAACCGAECCPS